MKRSAQTSSKATAKKAKQDPVEVSLAVVSAALTQAAGLTPEAAQMLCNALPACLGVPQDVRHKYQQDMVELVAVELSNIESAMQQLIREKQAAAQETESREASCKAAVAEAKASVETQQGVVQQSKAALANDALAFRVARQAVEDAEYQQKVRTKEIGKAASKKASLEKLLQDMETVYERPDEVEWLVQGLMGHLNPDDSMKTAMPSALAKGPDARGPFDVMVFEQLRATSATELQKLGATVEAGAPLKASLAEALRTASAALDAAREKQMAAAQAYNQESGELTATQDALAAAQAASKEASRGHSRAVQARDQAEAELDLFRQDVLSAFTFLRERVTPVAEEAAPLPEISEKVQEVVQERAPEEVSCGGA